MPFLDVTGHVRKDLSRQASSTCTCGPLNQPLHISNDHPPNTSSLSLFVSLSLFESFLFFCSLCVLKYTTLCVFFWGGGSPSECGRVYIYTRIQYDTHTNWWTGCKRADKASAKSEGGCTCNNDAVFDFPSTPWGSIYVHGGVV